MEGILLKHLDNEYIGIYFKTLSGSRYFIETSYQKMYLERFNRVYKLRQDTEKIEIRWIKQFEIGKGSIFCLEPLGVGNATFRFTSEVLDIIYFKNEQSFKEFKLTMIADARQNNLAEDDYL